MSVRIQDWSEYVRSERPRMTWLVEGLIPRPGYVLLAGSPKAGKSYLALDLARRVAQGLPVLGHDTHQGTPLYLQVDAPEGSWWGILHQVHQAGVDLTGVKMAHPDDQPRPLDVLSSGGQRFLAELVEAVDPALVVLDVLRDLHQRDENDSTSAKIVMDAITPILAGRSVLLVHHTRKIGKDETPDPRNAGRGSSYWTGKADIVWMLHRTGALDAKLYVEGRFSAPATYRLKRASNGLWEATADSELASRVVSLCDEFPDQTHVALARIAEERFGVKRSAYYDTLRAHGPCSHRRVDGAAPAA